METSVLEFRKKYAELRIESKRAGQISLRSSLGNLEGVELQLPNGRARLPQCGWCW